MKREIEPWQQALSMRLVSLAYLSPLQRLEDHKAGRSVVGLEKHDLRAIALGIFDAVIENMGLHLGADWPQVIELLTPLVRSAEPEAEKTRVSEIVELVRDFLLNEADRRRAFAERVMVWESDKLIGKDVRFHYLQQVQGPNDELLYRITVEGINIYTGTLGLDIEDAQAAADAVLQYQIGRGKISEAVSVAKGALAHTTAYEQKIHLSVDQARRDISQVDWVRTVLVTLDDARTHLLARSQAEAELIEAIDERSQSASEEDLALLTQLHGVIEECQRRHAQLHDVVLRANETYLREYDRQAFRPKAITAVPDLEGLVFQDALSLNAEKFEVISWNLFSAFLRPVAPAYIDTVRLAELLMAPPRSEEEGERSLDTPETEPLNADEARFSPEDYAAVDKLFQTAPNGKRVSELADESLLAGYSEDVQELVYLRAFALYGEPSQDDKERWKSKGLVFSNKRFYGDDLLLHREETHA